MLEWVFLLEIACDNAAEESLNSIIKTEAFYTEFGKKNFKNRQVRAEIVLSKTRWFIQNV